MTKTGKQKKLILDQAYLEEEFFENSLMLGLVCPLASYKFIWQLQTFLQFDFQRNHDFDVEVKGCHFPIFYLQEIDKMIEHFIFANRRQGVYLVPELKNIDYIWLLKGNNGLLPYRADIVEKLKKVSSIDSCFHVPIDSLKSKHLLIM